MLAAREPRELVAAIEANPSLPSGGEERFSGYGVMGMPFSTGHILALRRFPASSVGPGYRTVWHRDPGGRWTFFQDIQDDLGCARYFGASVTEVVPATIDVDWTGPRQLSVGVASGTHRLDWSLSLTSSAVTKVMNGAGSLLPEAVWRHRLFLAGMGLVAGPMMGAGKVRLAGRAPNGHHFTANPHLVWLVASSKATLDDDDLGPMGRSPTPGRLADFRIPQRGVFAIGTAFFTAAGAHDARVGQVARENDDRG